VNLPAPSCHAVRRWRAAPFRELCGHVAVRNGTLPQRPQPRQLDGVFLSTPVCRSAGPPVNRSSNMPVSQSAS